MLCRGSDTIDGDDNSVVGDAVEIVLQDFSSATHDDLPSDADNAVSSDDDDTRMVLLSDLLQSSRVPAFNPDRASAGGASSDFLLVVRLSSVPHGIKSINCKWVLKFKLEFSSSQVRCSTRT